MIKRYFTESRKSKILQMINEALLQKTDGINSRDVKLNEVTNYFLREKTTLYEDSIILSKLYKATKLKPDFWEQYLTSLNEKLLQGRDGDVSSKTNVKSSLDFGVLVEIANILTNERIRSEKLTSACIDCFNKNIYRIIPQQFDTFCRFLDYLVSVNFDSSKINIKYDCIVESLHEIKPYDLIHMLYSFGRLNIKVEDLIHPTSRILHNRIAKGMLTPYEKTKLARAYAILKHEHITFFKHISKELIYTFEQMELGVYNNKINRKDQNYVNGLGNPECFEPSGVICTVLPYVNDGTVESEPENVVFKESNTQLYTCGQIVYILDSMIYLRIHHLEKYFNTLMNYAMKHCFKVDILEEFDVKQLRCCISIFSNCKKNVDDEILEFITRRIIQEFMKGNVTNSLLSLFLKDLVRQLRIVVKAKNRRNRICYYSNFPPPKWINKPLHDEVDPSDLMPQKSIVESCCTRICDTVHTFTMSDLSLCLRSLAYLGFKNEKFYNIFVPFFRDRLSMLNNVAISNITQAFNKVGIKNEYFFHLLGKQHQLYLNNIDKYHKLYIKRIG